MRETGDPITQPAPRNLSASEATADIADYIYDASREWGLPIVLTYEDRQAIEAIVKRVG